jgi:cellulose synthase/poly-beta-1,6-N-acetylglucosamine synthase-like glycosyltransferase
MWFWIASLIIYFICSFWFLLSSIVQLSLFIKSKRNGKKIQQANAFTDWPLITIQVPVYNERFVIGRLLTALAKLDYPRSRMEVQVLDDSTDHTSAIIAERCEKLKASGITVSVLTRSDRSGFKAGALAAGLPFCRGEFIAIFDADFTPRPDFLKKIIPHFIDPSVAGVQGRWLHRNLRASWLTTIQSYLLDSHFTLEQQGRDAAGYLVNFNGTAGMWRKSSIEQAGGWNLEVLTEDLELSYRTQLKGWKMIYDNSITVPADLPVEMEAFKAQQFRWAKGMAQVAKIYLSKVMKANISLRKKIHALFHLTGSLSFVAVFGTMLLAPILMFARNQFPEFKELTQFILVTGITMPIICVLYYAGTKVSLTRKEFWLNFPAFVTVFMSLSVQNTVAVVQGLIGISTPFIRTPKPESNSKLYDNHLPAWTTLNSVELLVFIYLIGAIIGSVVWNDYFFLFLLLMGTSGLYLVLQPAISRVFAARTTSGAGV